MAAESATYARASQARVASYDTAPVLDAIRRIAIRRIAGKRQRQPIAFFIKNEFVRELRQ